MTQEQKDFIFKRKIKVGNFYMFPRWGFYVYEHPNFSVKQRVDNNPFTKSLDHEYFNVKEITGNGFVKGNFLNKEFRTDFYMRIEDIEYRDSIESLFLLIVCYVPFKICNLWKR